MKAGPLVASKWYFIFEKKRRGIEVLSASAVIGFVENLLFKKSGLLRNSDRQGRTRHYCLPLALIAIAERERE